MLKIVFFQGILSLYVGKVSMWNHNQREEKEITPHLTLQCAKWTFCVDFEFIHQNDLLV